MLFCIVGNWTISSVAGIEALATIATAVTIILTPLIVVAAACSILLALAGLGIMLYLIFKKTPNPVQEYVNKYVTGTPFYVSSLCGAIDYAIPYANALQGNLIMVGFTLSASLAQGGTGPSTYYLSVNPDGSISGSTSANLTSLTMPNCVWRASTDGMGMSQIFTIGQPDPTQPPVWLFLSLMSDNSVNFQPPLSQPAGSDPSGGNPAADGPTVATQT
jgi:hypothetical protein